MSALTVGIIIFAAMIVLVLIGVPIYTAMISTSIVGFLLISNPTMTVMQFTNGPFSLSASYTYAVVPLFMVVGTLAGETGLAAGAYSSARKWLGRQRGGLLYATVVANALFGACSGLAAAANVVFSRIALPELNKAKYNQRLSLGCITAAGCLSALIPPSVPIITFCLLTDVSIGQALMSGVSAGILLMAVMCIAIFIVSKIQPSKIPPVSEEDKNVSLKEKLQSLKYLLPILVLFGLIVGGSFFGWFPATVGGAVATMVLIIYAIVKKVPIKKIFLQVWDGSSMFGSIFLIIVAGTMFSRLVAMTGMADGIAAAIAAANIPKFAVFMMVVVFYLICGCLMELMSMMIITLPIVYPLLTGLGYHPLVLVVTLVFLMDMAQMTPPIGIGVFTVSAATNIPSGEIFKGVLPFFLVDLAMVILIALVPELVLWLPNLM